ncbi:4'-phosphopantetheinyl transferase family protein [Nonomuraea basaltis]|uniref:4'-phosphopantetheinyl transferase family protein n=1 Tax=Nonomuraea basaltis TaxID=2495887 RepID=UPI00110C537D|nr:4'-phosphopantetheinyl transferase superfamily protein [Nonomuraea basaltis]TMR99653.1 4'-phosphopantetheinyl transferase superfamily protein [Nonomuraea basaltis]
MIEDLLPPAAVALEAFDDPPGLRLYPEEAACMARAMECRRREFATTRQLARSGLTRLGLPPAGIPKGERGAPRWPDGVVGSITHCAGYRAAAVARAADLLSIGIDAEPHGPLPPDILEFVATPAERARLAGLAAANPKIAWDRLLFSAKESVYKAWFPLARSFLDFESADVEFDEATATFVARLLVPGPAVAGKELRELTGRFAVRDGLAVTAVALGPCLLPDLLR